MTFDELREEALNQGYRLVHRDCIRTVTAFIRDVTSQQNNPKE